MPLSEVCFLFKARIAAAIKKAKKMHHGLFFLQTAWESNDEFYPQLGKNQERSVDLNSNQLH